MQKINFQNLPNTTTPVNATNLNQVQTNVENSVTMTTVSQSDFCTLNSGFTMLNFNAWKKENFITGTMIIQSTNDISSSDSEMLVVKSPYRPPGGYFSYCGLSTVNWQVQDIGYIYYSRGTWTVKNLTGKSGIKVAIINFSYKCD